MFDSLLFDLMLVVLIGILSQWTAWKFRMPAIVVMSVAGLLVGPIFGFINPKESMGDLFGPIITFAVAIILFEGSLNLDFKEIKGFSKPVSPNCDSWCIHCMDCRIACGTLFGGTFVGGCLYYRWPVHCYGPTVILPLLRQAKLKPRPAAILKWEVDCC